MTDQLPTGPSLQSGAGDAPPLRPPRTLPERTKCSRCGMSFRVAEPQKVTVEFTTCAEHECARRYWTIETNGQSNIYGAPRGVAIVGMTPADFMKWWAL
jgi:hypothetical protein